MGDALAHVRTGAVTGAARDDAAEATPRFLAATRSASSTRSSSPGATSAETLEAVLAELSREASS